MKKIAFILMLAVGCSKHQECQQWDVVDTCNPIRHDVYCHEPTYLTITSCDGDIYPGKTIILDQDENRTEERTYLHIH